VTDDGRQGACARVHRSMSKAFTRESDELALARPHTAALPPGARNYLTAPGAARLHGELDRLLHVDRPAAAGDAEAVADIDHRIRDLGAQLDSAEIVDPAQGDAAIVRFGAEVTVRDDGGRDHAFAIVGVPEADPRHGRVSYLTPVARALLGGREGDTVLLPGRGEVAIVRIAYEPGAGQRS
jgi:transcription elongation factor GreB